MTTYANAVSMPLHEANLCLDCERLNNTHECQSCGAGALLAINPILNRRGAYRRTFDPSLYNTHYLMAHVPESDVQRDVLQWLRVHGCKADAVDAGGKQQRAKSGHRGGAGATIAGFPDIVGAIPGGRSLYLEVKAPQWITPSSARPGRYVIDRAAGEPSPEQLAFLDRMHDAGCIVGIVWGIDDAERIIRGAR